MAGRPYTSGASAAPAGRVTCEVWWATPALTPSQLSSLLDAAEQERHERYRREEDRARFLTARALARIVLGAKLGLPAVDIRFSVICKRCGGEHGKPRPEHGGAWEMSWSHSGERVVLALSHAVPVGVDVEQVTTRIDTDQMISQVLSPAELQEFDALPAARRRAAFLTYWTRKEAALKATGDGLSVSPDLLTVTAPDQPPALLDWRDADTSPGPVRMHDLDPGAGYLACLAALTPLQLAVTEQSADALLNSFDVAAGRPAR